MSYEIIRCDCGAEIDWDTLATTDEGGRWRITKIEVSPLGFKHRDPDVGSRTYHRALEGGASFGFIEIAFCPECADKAPNLGNVLRGLRFQFGETGDLKIRGMRGFADKLRDEADQIEEAHKAVSMKSSGS